MNRHRIRVPLSVYLNNRLVGRLMKEVSGAISFRYDSSWLDWELASPISLSLPLRDDTYIGAPVSAVFENLLPDSEILRRHVAEKVGAAGIDAYSLLSVIGRDCVGALQIIPEEMELKVSRDIEGEEVSEQDIASILRNLARSPLGLDNIHDFRISLAGVQEKTALLYRGGKWYRPLGTTPTTHILKPQIGHLPNGIDLSNSVENEYYCLKLIESFDLPVNKVFIEKFEKIKVLVVERFDRLWTQDGRLIRLPQEDCCQALSIPPTLKYQDQGGPGMVDILNLLKGSDYSLDDQITFFKSQILFWLMGVTDGHAKNFSLFLMPGGLFRLTPLYDVLTAQPSVDLRHIEIKQMKLAMSVGSSRHYKINEIAGRHFLQTGEKANLSKSSMMTAVAEIVDGVSKVFDHVARALPDDFPESIHSSVKKAVDKRIKSLSVLEG